MNSVTLNWQTTSLGFMLVILLQETWSGIGTSRCLTDTIQTRPAKLNEKATLGKSIWLVGLWPGKAEFCHRA